MERARNTFLSGGGRHGVLVDLPPDLPRAMADRRRIVQVLNNLFSNAARHAPESSPIRVTAAREGVDVAISVADEGRGIAPERLPHLFRKHGGIAGGDREGALGAAGLGLAICKGLVEAHGGRIRAASGGAGQGTEVTFTLPVAGAGGEDAAAGFAPAGPPVPRDGPEQIPVLVVDDDPKTLRYVRDALAGSDYRPLVTGDPEELPGLIQTERPRLVLLDLMLPGTDGIWKRLSSSGSIWRSAAFRCMGPVPTDRLRRRMRRRVACRGRCCGGTGRAPAPAQGTPRASRRSRRKRRPQPARGFRCNAHPA